MVWWDGMGCCRVWCGVVRWGRKGVVGLGRVMWSGVG